jgi:hypothetical protein
MLSLCELTRIGVYCITINGEPVLLEKDGELMEHGFYRNEFMLTTSEEKSARIAKRRSLGKLQRQSIRAIKDKPLKLVVKEMEIGAPFYTIFSNQGFTFYPL